MKIIFLYNWYSLIQASSNVVFRRFSFFNCNIRIHFVPNIFERPNKFLWHDILIFFFTGSHRHCYHTASWCSKNESYECKARGIQRSIPSYYVHRSSRIPACLFQRIRSCFCSLRATHNNNFCLSWTIKTTFWTLASQNRGQCKLEPDLTQFA